MLGAVEITFVIPNRRQKFQVNRLNADRVGDIAFPVGADEHASPAANLDDAFGSRDAQAVVAVGGGGGGRRKSAWTTPVAPFSISNVAVQ